MTGVGQAGRGGRFRITQREFRDGERTNSQVSDMPILPDCLPPEPRDSYLGLPAMSSLMQVYPRNFALNFLMLGNQRILEQADM